MIREIVAYRPKKPLAPNGHHKTLAVSFAWTQLKSNVPASKLMTARQAA